MGTKGERGVFQFQVECFQDESNAPEEWSTATREFRSISRWSAHSARISRRAVSLDDAEISRCIQTFVQPGISSYYRSNSMAGPIAFNRPSLAPPPRSPQSATKRRVESDGPKIPLRKSATRQSQQQPNPRLKVSLATKTAVPSVAPQKPALYNISIVDRVVKKTPPIPITSSDEESISPVTGPDANPQNSVPIGFVRGDDTDEPPEFMRSFDASKTSPLGPECVTGITVGSSATPPTPSPPPPAPPKTDVEDSGDGDQNPQETQTGRSNKQPLGGGADTPNIDGSEDESDSSLSAFNSDSPVILIETSWDTSDLTVEPVERLKRPSVSRAESPTRQGKKPRLSFNGIPHSQVRAAVDDVFRRSQPTKVLPERIIPENLEPVTFEGVLDDTRPFKRYDLPGGIMFLEDDALGDVDILRTDHVSRIFSMFAKYAILTPPTILGPHDDIAHTILKLAHGHASDLYCLVRRRKITFELFSQVILLHHASEAFYLTLDLVAARILLNLRRRHKPPSMKDKQVKVFPSCSECSNFIAVTAQHGCDQAFCLFCDMQYPSVTRCNGIQAMEFSSVLQPYVPPGGYKPTDADISIAEKWLASATQHPGPILSLLFSVFAMLPPGWGFHMAHQMQECGSDLKLCGHCGLGSIVGHTWHDSYRCTWCMGRRSTHRRNLENPDGLLYHIDHACKQHKIIEAECAYLAPLLEGNVSGDMHSDQEPYLTPSQGPIEYFSSEVIGPVFRPPVQVNVYHNAEFASEKLESVLQGGENSFTGISGMVTGSQVVNNSMGLNNYILEAGMSASPIDIRDEDVDDHDDGFKTTPAPAMQRVDATSPASISPKTTACFPIVEPAEFALQSNPADAAMTKMTDSLIARLQTTGTEQPAASSLQINASGTMELELDYDASEE